MNWLNFYDFCSFSQNVQWIEEKTAPAISMAVGNVHNVDIYWLFLMAKCCFYDNLHGFYVLLCEEQATVNGNNYITANTWMILLKALERIDLWKKCACRCAMYNLYIWKIIFLSIQKAKLKKKNLSTLENRRI